MPRVVDAVYRDPLDRVWLECARRVGLRVERSGEVYASTDGRGVLRLADAASMDADDCLAQMILHELCHSLVQGPESFERVDWGLDNESERDLVREHACLRLQRALLGRYGLEQVLAPTTEHRAFYDALREPFAEGREAASVLARKGLRRAERPPWGPHLHEALAATQTIVRATVGDGGGKGDAASGRAANVGDLLGRYRAPRKHPLGGTLHAKEGATCATCAWRFETGRARVLHKCRQHDGARVEEELAACDRWEPALDCQTCGACCREAYTAVEVEKAARITKRHPDLVVRENGYLYLRRAGDRCAALEGGQSETEGYECRVYEDRPSTCRDFTLGSLNCQDARRLVGLSI